MQSKIGCRLSIVLIIFLCSCTGAKRGKTVIDSNADIRSGEKILELSIRNNFCYKGVLIKGGKADIESGSFSGKFDIYAKQNSVGDYMISAMGPLGIELVRIYGVKDSTYIIDRINRTIYSGKTENVLKKYSLPSDLLTILLGDIPERAILSSETVNSKGEIEAFYDDTYYHREMIIRKDVLRAKETVIDKNVLGERLTFSYDKFVNVDGYTYPKDISIDCTNPLFHVEITIESIVSPVNEYINIKLPDYKTIRL